MDVRRFELPDTPDGQKQWAELHYRPTHGMTRITTQAQMRLRLSGSPDFDPLEVQDVYVLQLVERWLVFGDDGQPITFDADGVIAIPQDVLQPLYNECERILNDLDKRLAPAKDDGRPNRQQRRAGARGIR